MEAKNKNIQAVTTNELPYTWSPDIVQNTLWTVFRLAILGGLETNPGPVNPETVAALFDHLIDLASAQNPAPNKNNISNHTTPIKNNINNHTAPNQNNTNNPPPQTPDGNHNTYNTTNVTTPQEGAHHA